MSSTPELKLIKSDYKEDVAQVIQSAQEQDFDSVVILGYKNGNIYIQHSKLESAVRIIGALELAKNKILNP